MEINRKEKIKKILFKIKETRMKLGWSQYDMGEKLHMSQNAYYKLESGKTKLDLERFLEIANLLNIKPEKLLL